MRKNYFEKIVKYMKKVYNIENELKKIMDARVKPTYKTDQSLLPVLLGFVVRIRSFNELNQMLMNNEFDKVLKRGSNLPKIDAIRDTLKVADCGQIRGILKNIIVKAKENKVFEKGTIDGYVVTAIDGTQTFNSDKKSCKTCLKANKKGKTEQRNFHSSVVLSTIGQGVKLVVDYEQLRPGEDQATKDEGELTAAKRLIKSVSENHKSLIDVVVYDAIGCNSEWINACIKSNIDTVVRVKNNNILSIKEVKRLVNKSEPVEHWTDQTMYERVDVYERTFRMKYVDQELRFVKFLMKKPNKKRSQIIIITTAHNIERTSLFKIIRARQDIENSIFHNLKKECGLEHCFVHGGNAIEAVLGMMFIAFNLVQLFYHRRIKKSLRTQVELIRQFRIGIHFIKRSPEFIINTS